MPTLYQYIALGVFQFLSTTISLSTFFKKAVNCSLIKVSIPFNNNKSINFLSTIYKNSKPKKVSIPFNNNKSINNMPTLYQYIALGVMLLSLTVMFKKARKCWKELKPEDE